MSSPALVTSQHAIDAFIDALWLEEGLSKNTLAAYRRDLSLLAQWLAQRSLALNDTAEPDLQAYFAHSENGHQKRCHQQGLRI